jgi:hypothetical protein
MRKSTTSAQLQFSLVFLLIAILATVCHGQDVYKVGVMNAGGTITRFDLEIVVTDSTFSTVYNGQATTEKIINKASEHTFYTTDGTATNKVVITPISGKLMRFEYDHSIAVTQDQQFGGLQLFYFAKKD